MNIKNTLFKIKRNLLPALRGGGIYLRYSFHKRVKIGQKVRIASNTDIVLHPGCIAKIGSGTVIESNSILAVLSKGQFSLGEGSGIGRNNSIVCHNRISIGSNTLFGPNVMIYDHNHKYNLAIGVDRYHYNTGEVIIGNNCWIGANSVILKDVRIGNNVVIGAGSVVVKDIHDNCVAVGNPARVIKKLTENELQETN